ncbi:LOW QUALITY PROTEIN: transcription factor RSL3-like [Alnus glutinosa]|uniref:LOW QUALITY PROTEIN: transcription factor RSL3-like n=1 Tax=Alnus glutinosa TaxID=3517 RepID=UPI002D7804A0|nr:LOW QUALITY PROTEIN: transcription factor RSL3-like [Alnus glutinosa]
MVPVGATSEGEWGSLSGMCGAEEADFMAHLLNYSSIPNEINGCSSLLGVPSTFWPDYDSTINMAGLTDSSCISLECDSSRFYSFSEGTSYINGGSLSQESYHLSDPQPILTSNNSSMSMDSSSYIIDGDDCMNQEVSEGNAEDMPEAVLPDKDLQLERETEIPKPAENSKKINLGSGYASKKERIIQSKKHQKLSWTRVTEKATDLGLVGQSSSSCSSEDDSNAPNLKGKTRASRGSANNPQSIYARKRREKISGRLRVIQNLVPNGSKVDITTMLEEAVQYVKFLQLQIKVIAKDDLWMYAPIAYCGMDIGLA